MDVSPFGLGCSSAPITGSQVVAGTFIARADGTYLDQTTTSGEDRIALPPACLNISGTIVQCPRIAAIFQSIGYDTVTCAPSSDQTCLCDAQFDRAAGLGTLAFEPPDRGSFTTSGSILTLNVGGDPTSTYEYCASPNELVLLPRPTFAGTPRGKVVLVKQ